MENLRVVYDFKGSTIDRSIYDLSFDGADLKLIVQDTAGKNSFLEVNFEWVVQFEFESKEAMAALPNYQQEVLLELDASDYVNERQHRIGSYFTLETKRFALFLLDVGDLHVISRAAYVTRK